MENLFASDIDLTNEYHAVLVRGNEVGEILNIEYPLPSDDLFFIRSKDIKGKNEIECLGQKMPIFAEKRIEYPGEAIGIVIAKEKKDAISFAEDVKIFVEKDLNDAKLDFINDDIEKLLEVHKNRIIIEKCKKKEGIEECFLQKDKVVSSFFHFDSRFHYFSEPFTIKVHTKQNSFDIYVSTKWASYVQKSVASAIGESIEKVRVNPTCESYSLSPRIWLSALVAAQVAIAAQITKKNISLSLSFKESFLFCTRAPQVAIKHRTELEENGKIRAMSVLCVVDAGAFNLFIDAMCTQLLITSLGLYNVPLYDVKVIALKTPTALTDVFVGFGDYYTSAAIEKHISDIIDYLNFDPIEFRLENILKVQDVSITGLIKKDNYKIQTLISKAVSHTTFLRKYGAYRSFNKRNNNFYDEYCRGIGLSIATQYNGLKDLIKKGMLYSVEITLTTNEELFIKAEPSDAPLKKLLSSYAIKTLNIGEEKIIFSPCKNIEPGAIGPALTPCVFTILPILFDKCLTEIQKLRFRKPLPITVKKEYKVSSGRGGWDDKKMEGSPFISETGGVCVVELFLDKSIYNVKIKNIYIAVENDESFPKDYVLSSIYKATYNAISGVLKEKMPPIYKRASEYTISSPHEMPNIEVELINSNSTQVKGFELIVHNLVPAAFMSALKQILQNNSYANIPIAQKDIFNSMEEMEDTAIEGTTSKNTNDDSEEKTKVESSFSQDFTSMNIK